VYGGVDLVQEGFVRKDLIWLVSYPRSGNTWLRLLVANMLYPEIDCGYTEIDRKRLVPDVHQHTDCLDLYKSKLDRRPFFIKSHFPILMNYRDSQAKVVYLYRDPRDVAISSYHYLLWINYIEQSVTFKDFLLRRFLRGRVPFGSWKCHVSLWLFEPHGFDFHALSYEDLCKDVLSVVLAMLRFIKWRVDEDIVKQAVDRTNYQRLRDVKSGPEQVDLRKLGFQGKSGGWKSAFDAEMLEALWEQFGDVAERLGYVKGESE